MKRTTKKLSGPALCRFLRRLVGEEHGLTAEQADRLAERLGLVLSSVRVRAMPWPRQRLRPRAATSPARQPAAAIKPQIASPAAAVAPPQAAPSSAQPPAAFDPYVIGLVPTFQREGRDGLLKKLAAIAATNDLRKMAKAQQVSLPEALRQGDVAVEVLRAAIADAVAKRIADRRAAAG